MSDRADEEDPVEDGFCHPSEKVSEPCLVYMARIMEMRTFFGFYLNFVKTSQELAKLIPSDATVPGNSLQLLRYDYSNQRPFVNQIMLSRAAETFDLYLTTILRDVFLARPEMLKSEGTVDIATVIEAGNYEDLIWGLIERKVHELSYRPLTDLRKFIVSRTGIDLFPSNEAFEATIIASEVRNLIAHNDCRMNDLFKARTKGLTMPLGVSATGRIEIDDKWLRRTSYTLDSIVFRFDDLAAMKFNLHRVLRTGSNILKD